MTFSITTLIIKGSFVALSMNEIYCNNTIYSVIVLSVIKLSVVMLSVVMLSVVMLSVAIYLL
jgi:hypothetical protein